MSNKLSDIHEAFCLEYSKNWNALEAYIKVYPDSTRDSARANAYRILKNEKVKERIEELKKDLEAAAGVSKLMVVKEHMKIAFSSFANIQKDWLTQKEFSELTDEEKACIASIEKEETFTKTGDTISVFRIKLHDKQKALENISKLLGYNDKKEIEGNQSFTINIIKPEE